MSCAMRSYRFSTLILSIALMRRLRGLCEDIHVLTNLNVIIEQCLQDNDSCALLTSQPRAYTLFDARINSFVSGKRQQLGRFVGVLFPLCRQCGVALLSIVKLVVTIECLIQNVPVLGFEEIWGERD